MLPNWSDYSVLSRSLPKTAKNRVCFLAHVLCLWSLAAACDGHSALEVDTVSQGQNHPAHHLQDGVMVFSHVFLFFFSPHCSIAAVKSNCVMLISCVRKIWIFFTSFSKEAL